MTKEKREVSKRGSEWREPNQIFRSQETKRQRGETAGGERKQAGSRSQRQGEESEERERDEERDPWSVRKQQGPFAVEKRKEKPTSEPASKKTNRKGKTVTP